jgi:SNF2 family DNA or RNA helicase
LKRDVATELPPKTEVTLHADLSPHERTAYEAILGATRSELLERVGEKVDIFSLLEALLRLRQACCHLALVPGYSARSSSKLDILMESLESSLQQGHRALIFSQWTSLLDLVEPRLNQSGVSFSRIDGSTKNRQEVTENFQRPDGPSVMLLSLKAGGLGLTLTAADHVYILDPWWNPAVEDQAADRVYRIGQENPVLVHRLVARDTIEERVLELQRSKRSVSEAIVGGGGDGGGGGGGGGGSGAALVSKDDLLRLLSPSGAHERMSLE